MSKYKERSPDEEGTSGRKIDVKEGNFIYEIYSEEALGHLVLSREKEYDLGQKIKRGQQAEEIISQNGHLPAKEEERLEKDIEEGEEAKERLITSNFRLVANIAAKYQGRGVHFYDLIQEGNTGLMKAVKGFDVERGNRFSTYATWWIRQAVSRAVADQGRTIRVPVHEQEKIRKLGKVSEKLESQLGRKPTVEELAKEMGVTPKKVKALMKESRRIFSLNMPVGVEKDSELGDFIENEQPSPEEMVSQEMRRERVKELLDVLTPRERKVLILRFGLDGGGSRTLEKVGEFFGVTRERARQIEAEALRKLRHPSRSRELRDYLK